MLWSKQFYNYDVDRWLDRARRRPVQAGEARRRATISWHHMHNADIISMPDKWEYPWYAAWDLAFHVLALTLVDEDFGKQQLDLMLQRALPASERADSRVRMELRRRQPAGARVVHDLHLPPGEGAARQGRSRLARTLVPQAAAQFHLVGQPQGPRRATTCSKAASSASTTSACSTAARRCRPAATWNRRTAPPGWRSSARTCSRSPRELALEKPAYADMCAQVRRALPLDRVVDGACRRGRRHVGRGRRLLLRRAAPAGRRVASA